MPFPADTTLMRRGYANPERLVSAAWLSAHLGMPGLVVVECDEDPILYNIGHIPGAVRIDWRAELSDPVVRDFIDGASFAALMDSKGISREDTVVLYGDHSNSWAAYAAWIFDMFGHPDVRLLDGGRAGWMNADRETSFAVPERVVSGYPVVDRDDAALRAFRDEVLSASQTHSATILDVRSLAAYQGKDPTVGQRGGHIPSAYSVDCSHTLRPDGMLKSRAELEEYFYANPESDSTIVYCERGNKAALARFILVYLLGRRGVRVYDGSWAEWGNMVRAPISTRDRLEM